MESTLLAEGVVTHVNLMKREKPLLTYRDYVPLADCISLTARCAFCLFRVWPKRDFLNRDTTRTSAVQRAVEILVEAGAVEYHWAVRCCSPLCHALLPGSTEKVSHAS